MTITLVTRERTIPAKLPYPDERVLNGRPRVY